MGTVLAGDNSFRTEYVTRFASTWRLEDYTFEGLHAFNPPAWFWLAGRYAWLTDAEPWRVLQPATLVTQALSVVLTFGLWRLSVRSPVALAATIGSSVMIVQLSADPTSAWYSPYSAGVAVMVVPWVVAAYSFVTGRYEGMWRPTALVAVGSVLALTYYLIFVIACTALLALLLRVVFRKRQELLRLAVLMGGVGVLTAVFWIPFAFDLLRGSATQGSYFDPELLDVDTGLDSGTAVTIIVSLVAVGLFVTRKSGPSRALLALACTAIGYQALSALTMAMLEQHLQPHRAATLFFATVGAALPVAAAEAQNRLAERPEAAFWQGHVGAAVAAVIALPMLAVASSFPTPLFDGDLVKMAHPGFKDSGLDRIARSITNASGREAEDLVVASAIPGVLALHPFHGFVPWNAHYAHPRAQLNERVHFLQQAAACPDSTCLNQSLEESPFEAIEAFVLERGTAGRLGLGTETPGFPEATDVSITFRSSTFDPARWTRRDVGPYAVLISKDAKN